MSAQLPDPYASTPAPAAHEPAPIRRGMLYEDVSATELEEHVRWLLARRQRPQLFSIIILSVGVFAWLVWRLSFAIEP